MELNKLTMNPENYALDVYAQLPQEVVSGSLMADVNRRFISGLISIYKPKRILEIGVAFGGGTSVILNAIKDMPESRLYSIDRASKSRKLEAGYQTGDACDIGYLAKELFPEFYANGKAKLFVGNDASHIIEDFGEKFDFAIIDTAHIHPIETFNFLTVLPFLNDGAIVVLDDISLYYDSMSPCYATRLLFDCVVGNKLKICGDDYFANNVAAFQVTSDTHKYIENVFHSLMFPWGMLTEDVDSVETVIKKYYDENLYGLFVLARKFAEKNLFKQALGIQKDWFADACENILKFSQDLVVKKKTDELKQELSPLDGKRIIYYGASACCRETIELIKAAKLTQYLPAAAMDKNADSIKTVGDIPVVSPDLDQLTDDDFILITIREQVTAEAVMKQLEAKGFQNYMSVLNLELIL